MSTDMFKNFCRKISFVHFFSISPLNRELCSKMIFFFLKKKHCLPTKIKFYIYNVFPMKETYFLSAFLVIQELLPKIVLSLNTLNKIVAYNQALFTKIFHIYQRRIPFREIVIKILLIMCIIRLFFERFIIKKLVQYMFNHNT